MITINRLSGVFSIVVFIWGCGFDKDEKKIPEVKVERSHAPIPSKSPILSSSSKENSSATTESDMNTVSSYKSTNSSADCRICGTWNTSTYIKGTACNITWQIKPNQEWNWFITCGGGTGKSNVSEYWYLEDNSLYETKTIGKRQGKALKIEWGSGNSSFTIRSETEMYDGLRFTKSSQKGIVSKNTESRQGTILCPVCKGDGRVVDGVGVDCSCLSSGELAASISATIYGGDGPPPKVWIRCCYCKGARWISK